MAPFCPTGQQIHSRPGSDIIVHIQHHDDHAYYALERLWKDCPAIPLPEDMNARAVQRVRVGEDQ